MCVKNNWSAYESSLGFSNFRSLKYSCKRLKLMNNSHYVFLLSLRWNMWPWKGTTQNNLRNFLEYSIKIFWWKFSTPVLTAILVSCCSLKSNSMILLLVFGSRPQWLMNFARSLLNLTRGKTLIFSPIRRGAKCKSILRYRRPWMESLYLQNN